MGGKKSKPKQAPKRDIMDVIMDLKMTGKSF